MKEYMFRSASAMAERLMKRNGLLTVQPKKSFDPATNACDGVATGCKR